ncbi:MAG TPA: hypothetical protein VL949_07535 [Geobacteraceae bacterium]|nr:hypothetical protein [Geobacteraceae bacterium]
MAAPSAVVYQRKAREASDAKKEIGNASAIEIANNIFQTFESSDITWLGNKNLHPSWKSVTRTRAFKGEHETVSSDYELLCYGSIADAEVYNIINLGDRKRLSKVYNTRNFSGL